MPCCTEIKGEAVDNITVSCVQSCTSGVMLSMLRYRQGTVLDAAMAASEQVTLETSRPKRLTLEALVDRARRILLAGDKISY